MAKKASKKTAKKASKKAAKKLSKSSRKTVSKSSPSAETGRQYWLVKTEPGAWSWDDHWGKSGRIEPWDGVRNYQASNNMKAMQLGDLAFMYHSVNEKAIVGVLEVVKLYYPDPSDESGRFGMVDFKAIEPVKTRVTLADVKAETRLAEIALVRQSRLSVMPVTLQEWLILSEMAGIAIK